MCSVGQENEEEGHNKFGTIENEGTALRTVCEGKLRERKGIYLTNK